MESYDSKFNNFLVGAPFEIKSVRDNPILQFREIENEQNKVHKVNIRDILSQQYQDEIGQSGNLKSETCNSTPPNLIEFDN